ncbi:MAG: endonuclease domain-containing protein [Candidatus Falkowbacteria bacterium]|nr:endonuclease domain-containing protein [Candidatus Falkowbacteria bacterium]
MRRTINNKVCQVNRRKLRKNMTKAERILWFKLKNKQVNGYRFCRQTSISNYIVDFYCSQLRLVIEIDGDLHYLEEKTIEYDKKRQREIEKMGIRFLRFTNYEIYKNLRGVLVTIENIALPKF